MVLFTGSLVRDLADCDLVIEAVFEQMAIKQDVFAHLDRVAKPGAILASNTSYLDIDAIAACTCVRRMCSACISSRRRTSCGCWRSCAGALPRSRDRHGDETRTIGKVGVVVGNCHGFVGNRMLAARNREADRLVLEGAAVGRGSRAA